MKNIIKTKKLLAICSLGIFLLLSFPVFAQSTRDFQIPSSIFSGGGGTRISSSYRQLDVFGEPVVGLRTSTDFVQNDGFLGDFPEPDTIYVSINDTAANSGDTFLYPIYVSDIYLEFAVEAYNFTLTYDDTTVITTTGNYEIDGTLSDGCFVVVNNTVSGEIIVGAISFGYLSGEGVLIFIEFQVDPSATPGSTCNLEITEFTFNEGNPVADLSGAQAVFTVFQPWAENVLIWIDGIDVKLSWTGEGNLYRIYRSTNPYTGFSSIDTTSDTTYIDEGAATETKYFYYITAE